jgi:hypothetical protein
MMTMQPVDPYLLGDLSLRKVLQLEEGHRREREANIALLPQVQDGAHTHQDNLRHSNSSLKIHLREDIRLQK